MKKLLFDVYTTLQSNAEYPYNGEFHIYLADSKQAADPKYFCTAGDVCSCRRLILPPAPRRVRWSSIWGKPLWKWPILL